MRAAFTLDTPDAGSPSVSLDIPQVNEIITPNTTCWEVGDKREVTHDERPSVQLQVVENWLEELKQRAPVP